MKIKNQNGFTLIEVLIAAVLIVMGMLAMGSFLGNYVYRNGQSAFRTDATAFAQEKLEELRTIALTQTLDSSNSTHQNTTGEALDHEGNILGTAGTVPGEIYTRFWRMNTSTDPVQIDVLVSWDGTTTTEKNVSLSSLINVSN